jgi:biotin carboxyl carrier protein
MAIIKIWNKNIEYKIEKRQKAQDNFIFNINKKIFDVFKIKEIKDIILLEINSQIYKAKILNRTKNNIEIYIFNFNKSFNFSLKNTKNINGAKLAPNENDFKEEILSPIAGRVIKINVQKNQFINKNDLLVTIESMKMENEIRAQFNGFIKNIQIAPEDLVQPNEILMKISKKGEYCAKTKNKNGAKEI